MLIIKVNASSFCFIKGKILAELSDTLNYPWEPAHQESLGLQPISDEFPYRGGYQVTSPCDHEGLKSGLGDKIERSLWILAGGFTPRWSKKQS